MSCGSPKRRALVTNDDGISSAGLHHLATVAAEHDLEVVVAAPRANLSGASAAISAAEEAGRIVMTQRTLPGLDGIPAYAVAASPAMIALVATRGAFGAPPDLVLSGINRGANVGKAVLHSGTVGAALTASSQGCPSLAVSLDVPADAQDSAHWTTAAHLVGQALTRLAELVDLAESAGSGQAPVINLNVPNVALDRLPGIRTGALARFGAVQTSLTNNGYPTESSQDGPTLTVAEQADRLEPGTDAAWLAAGYACVTTLQPICDAHDAVPGLVELFTPRP